MRIVAEAKELRKTYAFTEALQGISLTVHANDFIAVLGKSGSGKTTLFHILDGMLKPDTGEVFIMGQNIFQMKKRDFITFRRKRIGYVFQNFALIPELSVLDNVLFPVDLDQEEVDPFYLNLLLEQLDIQHLQDRIADTLSGGECQRVAIARALINKPDLVLADEPTGNLDSDNTERVMRLLVQLQKKFSLTVLIATHDYAVAKYTNRVFVLKDGRIWKDALRYE